MKRFEEAENISFAESDNKYPQVKVKYREE